MLFFAEFPLYICEDANKSFDLIKTMQLMVDPAEAQKAIENAEDIPLKHEGQAGRVVMLEDTEKGLRIIIQSGTSNQLRNVEYTSVLVTSLKVGDLVQPNELIGIIKNPRKSSQ
jgi:hypothetical protein